MRKIIHVDMDCFYAAVEMRDRPELRGKPVAVGGSPEGRGVVAAANYEARKYGVKSAVSAARALRLCPHLQMVRPNFEKYKYESRRIRKIFEEFTQMIEPLSLDEAYLDVSESKEFKGSATLIAQEIRRRIFETTGLTASAGIASNKFLAKVASDWNKPNGQLTITPQMVDGFMLKLPVGKIPGVGKVTGAKMNRLGIFTCGDLQKRSLEELTKNFGVWGTRLFSLCRGEDHRSVSMSRERKSLSVERTFSQDLVDIEKCLEQVPGLLEEFDRRFDKVQDRLGIKGIFVKLKFNDFSTTTMAQASVERPNFLQISSLVRRAYDRAHLPVRLIGLGVRTYDLTASKPLTKGPQMALFE